MGLASIYPTQLKMTGIKRQSAPGMTPPIRIARREIHNVQYPRIRSRQSSWQLVCLNQTGRKNLCREDTIMRYFQRIVYTGKVSLKDAISCQTDVAQ